MPRFELPGDARQALQQAEALKAAQASPVRRRPLARPTFELPGEAISRRKREERDARLRAQEDEERRRREFKVRPVRHSLGPATPQPRDTAASRVRQTRLSKSPPPRDAAGKRGSLSTAELELQRRRGRDVVAREQAAARSRTASREWADKKRRHELAAKTDA